MKTLTTILTLVVFFLCQSVVAQNEKTILPKIEDYPKGELEIKIKSFGENNPITIGKVLADGTIYFDWPELDLAEIKDNNYFTTSIKHFIGSNACKDPNAIITKEDAILVETKYLFLFKYGQAVGSIIPSTQKGQQHNTSEIGSTLKWIYSYEETNVNAIGKVKLEWEDLYSIDQTTEYNLNFKKGWNLVSHSLEEIEKWQKGEEKGSQPKRITVKSIDEIPTDMHWHLRYWANDELIEMEQKLLTETPITKKQYENWLPKKLGDLKRTEYEIGKEIERLPTPNNINILFQKGSKTLDLTIVDCVASKEAGSTYTLMQDMASRDWRDKTDTGYASALEMDGNRVVVDYNEVESKSMLTYNTMDRFTIKAEAKNMEPEELWKLLKNLELEKLLK